LIKNNKTDLLTGCKYLIYLIVEIRIRRFQPTAKDNGLQGLQSQRAGPNPAAAPAAAAYN
jgi:hypothetical protein